MVNYGVDKSAAKRVIKIEEDDTSYTRFCVSKFVEFCKRTDLHGYKYIVMKELSVFERSVWAVSVLLSMAFAVYFLLTAYEWYARNPIMTVIESTQGAIWDIPFPAITICNLNVVSRRAARVFSNNLSLPVNVTADEVYKMTRLVPLLHTVYMASPEQKQTLATLQTVLDLNHITTEMLFMQLSPAWPCSRLVERCMWKNTVYRCDSLFKPILTHLNQCCTFNYYGLDKQITKDEPATPMRVASCGYQTALTVLLNTDPGDYYSVPIASQGAVVLIDYAYNIPDIDSPIRMVNPSTELLIALSPERTFATGGVRAFSPDVRHCYYHDEVKIGNFRQYSFHNCMAFHRVELIKNVCECIPYYFPLQDFHRMCNFNDLECLESVSVRQERYMESEKDNMRCLPECEHYDYLIEVALGKLAQSMRLDGLPFYNDINKENRSLVNVFFNDLVSTRYRRDVYLNWQNLLASFGGLLSLMLGFTLIAGFDLLLFFTFGMAYGSITSHVNEEPKGRLQQKAVRPNKVYVKEIKGIDKSLNKMIFEKDLAKWQFEKQFDRPRY